MNLVPWRRFSFVGEGTAIAGTAAVGGGRAGIVADFSGVEAEVGVVQ